MTDFNSTIVRLKVLCAFSFVETMSYFNSTIVRLKGNNLTIRFNSALGFQFYNSSIKSQCLQF